MKKISRKKIKITLVIIFLIIGVLLGFYFLRQKPNNQNIKPQILRNNEGKIIIAATLFPIYDFAKEVGGDKVSVDFLLPPGIESHAFSPTDKEYRKMASSSLIFYSSGLAEPWVSKILQTRDYNFPLMATAEGLNDDKNDPHVWLDFTKDLSIVDNIKTVYQNIDPANANYYQAQADQYKVKLLDLDSKYSQSLKKCQFHDLVQGGHQAFSYLARRYNLNYFPSQGIEPNLEVNTDVIKAQISRLKTSGQGYVFYEELTMPSLADLVREQTGAKMIMLNAAHNVARYDIESGFTFIKIMENNLNILKLGLSCQ
jgi:zinc transport system substrate-binding protein